MIIQRRKIWGEGIFMAEKKWGPCLNCTSKWKRLTPNSISSTTTYVPFFATCTQVRFFYFIMTATSSCATVLDSKIVCYAKLDQECAIQLGSSKRHEIWKRLLPMRKFTGTLISKYLAHGIASGRKHISLINRPVHYKSPGKFRRSNVAFVKKDASSDTSIIFFI